MSGQPAMSRPAATAIPHGGAAQPAVPPQRDAAGDEGSLAALPSVRLTGEPASNAAPRPGLDMTAVLPYAGSRASKRTRWLRAWMMTAPVDVVALLAPLLVSQNYWRGTLANAGLTVAVFATGGLYRARRHLSILDELPSLGGRLLACGAVVAIIAAERHDSVPYISGFMHGVALSAGLVILGRAASRKLTVVARKRRWVEHNAIVIGSGPVGGNSPGWCAATLSTACASLAASTPRRGRAWGRSR